jgi:hypothetical protein
MGEVAEVPHTPQQVALPKLKEAQARHRRAEGAADLAAAAVEGTATAILVLTTKQIQIQLYKRIKQRLGPVIGNEPPSTAIRPLKTTSGQTLLRIDPRRVLIPDAMAFVGPQYLIFQDASLTRFK